MCDTVTNVVSHIQCPFCQYNSKQEPRFYDHLIDVHAVHDHEACYVQYILAGVKPTCQCSKECSEPIKWLGWKKGYKSKFTRGHNARIDSSFNDPDVIKRAAKKRKDGYASGKYRVWNAGLSKNTDERIATMSKKIGDSLNERYAAGKIIDWRVEDPRKAAESAKKISQTKKRLHSQGLLSSWNKGLTKDTDKRLDAISKKISKAWDRANVGRRLHVDDIIQRISAFPQFELLSSPNDYRTRRIQRLAFRCKQCNNVVSKSLAMLEETPICFFCNPKESVGQLELFEFVKSIDNTALLSDRSLIAPKELDILVPSKLAIEFDGLYWHSEKFLDKHYVESKRIACKEKRLNVVRIFEDEWRDKRQIIEGMIKHRLGIVERKLGARQCTVDQLKLSDRRQFFNMNHLDGDVNARVAFGLRHYDELVAALSIRVPNHKIHQDYFEVARFSVKKGIAVIGALSKLTKAAQRYAVDNKKKGLITYVDLRYGTGVGYVSAGYKPVKMTASRFWWTDFKNRYDRFMFRASTEKTQREIAEENGVVKIYGCPNLLLKTV